MSKKSEYQLGGQGPEGKGLFGRLRLRTKLMAVGAAVLAGVAMGPGRGYLDQASDWLHADEYYASQWVERDAWAVASWGKIIADASQNNDIDVSASVGDQEIKVNLFQDGIKEGGTSEFPFTQVHGLPYAVMLTLSQGNPEFRGRNSTGGILPLPLTDSEQQPVGPRLASELGYDTHDPFNPEQSAVLWMRYMNELTARAWLSTEDQLSFRKASTPQGKQELVVKEAISDYFRSLGIDPTPLLPGVYSLAVAHTQTEYPEFKKLLETNPEMAAKLEEAKKIIIGKPQVYGRYALKLEEENE